MIWAASDRKLNSKLYKQWRNLLFNVIKSVKVGQISAFVDFTL